MKQAKKSFWTAGRALFASAVFAATALYASSCVSNDTANLTATQNAQQASKPKVTITESRPAPGQQPQAPAQRPQLQVVPAVAWETQMNAVGGGSFKLSDYKDKTIVLDLWA